jgi:hypothetical protein
MLNKFKPKGGFKFLHIGQTSIEVATATDEEIEALRKDRPDTFNTYFEEVKAPKVAETGPDKKGN